MTLDTHIDVSVNVNNQGVVQIGFGTIGVLSHRAGPFGANKSLTFSQYADAVKAGFPSDGPEALAILRVMNQSPHVKNVKLLKGTNIPTISYKLEVVAGVAGEAYEANVKGEGVTATKISYVALPDLTFADADVNVGTDSIHIAAHGLATGQSVRRLKNVGGALPTGLAADTNVWPIVVDADHVKLATSKANALANVAIDITAAAGGGVNTLVGAQNDTIVANLVTQAAAVVGLNYAAAQVAGAGETDYATLTGTAPGKFFTVELLDTSALKITNTTADAGITADWVAAQIADNDFFYVDHPYTSAACIEATAAWVETETKAYIAYTNDTAVENTAAGGGDVADTINNLGYKRTVVIYHRKPDQMIGVGAEGRVAPLTVGKWTLAYKSIAGCTADKFTDTQFQNLDAKKCSYYKVERGRSIIWKGAVGNTSYGFLDTTVALDRFVDDLQTSGFGVFVGQDKVDYDDADIEHLRSAMFGAVTRGVRDTFISPGTPGSTDDPEPTLTFPKVADIDPATRALRELPGGACAFRYDSPIHTVDVNVSVNF